MNNLQNYLSTCLLATAALLGGAAPAFAAAPSAPSLGAASDFAVLSVGTSTTPSTTTDATAAVSTTDSTVIGNVGSAGAVSLTDSAITGNVVLTGAFVPVRSTFGAIIMPLPVGVITDFNGAYDALAGQSCDSFLTGTLAGITLTPGVYCFSAAAALTGTLTLAGSSTDTWLFKIGTSGTGALTGTNFSVVMSGGGDACNVTWWVDEAVTMTTSGFQGTILAGAAITMTGLAEPTTSYNGGALAKAAVTLTNFTVTGCEGGSLGGTAKPKCNQGVGNGPEGCDPGNSNQSNRYPNSGNPFLRSNDETSLTTPGGVPGNPGRKGGNK